MIDFRFMESSRCFVLARRLVRDVIGHYAGEKAAAFDVDEADALEQLVQFARLVEVPDGIREIAHAFHALGGTPEQLGGKPDREPQIGEVRHFDDARCRTQHVVMAEDAARLEHPMDLLERADDLEMARGESVSYTHLTLPTNREV